jgi:cell division protein FtsB
MGVIEELSAKLRGAQRAKKRAQQEYDAATADAAERRKALQKCEARVDELERAISLLRNGLKTPVVETGNGNVTPLKRT